ncbi:uncharacterized protein EDB93DRAFT_1255905 [Suillus bovinus]|uniref:uncharacterized protein n=1 Tax=Suillus bovinus TaxID=48563 RepID=UPI001B86F628|nr:uncharacterized protein EDB93DRAFT_1255905 [Suillus bovinus]KAG2130426.1 hypothetical protein EDB93DRAFT_1255905 [Suillus bovinus]
MSATSTTRNPPFQTVSRGWSGPDGWAVVAGEYIPRVLPKASNLSPFGDITNGPPSPGDFGADTKDSERMALSQTRSSSNMLNENHETAPEASTNPSRSSMPKDSVHASP